MQLRFQVPPDVGLLGTDLLSTATVSTSNTEADLSNNTYLLQRTITGAYDPNDKLATTSSGNTDVWQLNEDEWIDYTIRFQNTGTDTAFNVVITDTLPANLDPGSIVMGASSHTFTWELRDAGTLKFYFPNILLPDSNINEPRSHGFVGFRIRPRLPLLPGDEIDQHRQHLLRLQPADDHRAERVGGGVQYGAGRSEHGQLAALASAGHRPAEHRLVHRDPIGSYRRR